MTDPVLLWEPSDDQVRRSQMHDFLERIAVRHGISRDWEALRRWAIECRHLFWGEMFEYAGIQPTEMPIRVCSGEGMLGTTWFEGCRLNYARHLLRLADDQPAILFENELGPQAENGARVITRRQLRDQVARFAHALRREGVRKGDRVAGYLPNIPETVIAMLAAASLGAIWSSCSPDFGVRGVLDRFTQIEPAVLVAASGYTYGGKRYDLLPRLAELLPELPTVRRLVVVPYPDDRPDSEVLAAAARASGQRAVLWSQYSARDDGREPELRFEEVPFDHPLFIMYSSGTTGIPKCIVHGHGGTLLQHAKELLLHVDLRRDERIFYFTTCGWMMWNWLVSGLAAGAAIVLYEGNPAHPDIHRLWDMAARHRVNVFGASPKFLAACEKAGIQPGRSHDLAALRCLCSTGSPLAAEQFEWVYANVKPDLLLASICGGTDIISCFMLGNPMLPVYAGEIQCRGLGMDVHAWDESGKPVIGRKGELVCTSPFPSQPVGFWNDPDGGKYRKAYFDHFPGVWRHGDYIEITPRGGVVVYGRSDATLNPGGVRIGTAEIYRLVEGIPEIVDSIVVGKREENDEAIALFVVLRPGLKLQDPVQVEQPAGAPPGSGRAETIAQRIRRTITEGATKRHVPKYIRQVSDIPRTISGKKTELAVQQVLQGEEVKNRDALANPEALDQFRNILCL